MQPATNSTLDGTPASVTDGAVNVPYTMLTDLKGDFGNAFSVDLIDPGAINSPLMLSSTDGYTMTISLETDGAGVIVTTGQDIQNLLTSGNSPGTTGQNWAIVCDAPNSPSDPVVAETLPLAGGAVANVASVSYRVTGSY